MPVLDIHMDSRVGLLHWPDLLDTVRTADDHHAILARQLPLRHLENGDDVLRVGPAQLHGNDLSWRASDHRRRQQLHRERVVEH